jgi:RNA polymerase sigma factor (sigma-70 family)
VVQEAFVRAFRQLSSFRRGSPFRPWLLRIVANQTHNATRSRSRRAELALRAAGPEPATGPEDAAIDADRRERLLAAVRVLPWREQQPVICRFFLQLSEAETAQVLGWPIGTVKSRATPRTDRSRN